ncbi:MAG: polysaccharide deacetylase [Clostridia bacterium]|nr:polysaccharide deacetylase [Clostridia bacterium]
MSKELIEVKKDGFKAKIKDFSIMFLIVILGSGIMFLSFYISYDKFHTKENAQDVYHIEIVPDSYKTSELSEDKEVDEKDIENAFIEKEEELEEDKQEVEKEELVVEQVAKKEEKTKTNKNNEKLPQWNNSAVEDIKSIYSSNEKQIYLTFDDGPSPEITSQVLAILKKEKVPATFFVLGKSVEQNPELVKQAYEDGHFIANHSYTHTYSKIYSSIDNLYAEYNKTNEAIRNAIDNQEYDPHLFRFPGGSSGGPYDALKRQAKQFLADNQIASTNWNCLTSDAAGKTTVDGQFQEVLDTQGNKTSLIILLHDCGDKKATPETLKKIIKHYKNLGYEFKNFYDIFTEEVVEENEEVFESSNN